MLGLICCPILGVDGLAFAQTNATRVQFAGGENTALGQAGLTVTGDRLVVSNIGSSGQDGVSIQLTEAQFGVVAVDASSLTKEAIGSQIEARAIGYVNGQAGRTINTLRATVVQDGLDLSAIFASENAKPISAVIFDGDKIVAQANNLTSTVARVTSPIRVIKFDPIWPMCPRCPWAIIDLPDRPVLVPPGGEPVQATRIAIIPGGGFMPNPEDPDPEPWGPIGPVSRIDLVGRGLNSLILASEQIGLFHQAHQALGQTSLRAMNGTLVLRNSGDSLEDGVDLHPDDANALDVRWSPLPDSVSGVQRTLRLGAWGTWDTTGEGKPAEFLGAVRAVDSGQGLFEIHLEQPQANVTSALVAIFRQGTLVGSFHAEEEMVVMALAAPFGGSIHSHPFGPGPYCFWLDWPIPSDFFHPKLPGVLKGDQIRITPDTLPGSLAKLDRLRLNLAGIPELVLTDERHDQEGLRFAGNDHTAIGDTRLVIVESTQSNTPPVLSVEGTSQTTQTGVRILAGEAQSIGVLLDGIRPSLLPTGALLRLEPRGDVAGIPGQSMGRLLVEALGDQARIYPDFSPLGVRDYSIAVYDGERLVASTAPTGDLGSPTATTGTTAFGAGPGGLVISDALMEYIRFYFDYWCLRHRCWEIILVPKPFPWPWPGPDPRELPEFFVDGIGKVRGDRIAFMPAGSPIRPGDLAHELSITGHNLPSFQIVQESLRQFGQPHLATGQAEFLANAETLTVANLGMTGNDGLDFDLGRAQDFSLKFQTALNPDPTPWVAGGLLRQPTLRLLAHGSIGGVSGQLLGTLELVGHSNRVAIIPDYSPVGGLTSTVEVYRHREPVRRQTGQRGEVATVPEWPISCGKQGGGGISHFPPPPPCYILTWPEPLPITLADGSVVMGDEIRVLTEVPGLKVDALERFGLRTTGFESLTLGEEYARAKLKPIHPAINVRPGMVTVAFDTEPEIPYVIQYRGDLNPQTPWQTMGNITGDGGRKLVQHQVDRALQGYYGIVPVFGRPDLVVTELRATGAARVLSDGRTQVPLRVTVRNQGTAPAGRFKTSVEYTSPLNIAPFVVAFTVPGQVDIWYPHTSAPLAPGDQQTFDGTLTFHSSVHNLNITLRATADSCAGDEFMPDWCRVLESDETNNQSAEVPLALP